MARPHGSWIKAVLVYALCAIGALILLYVLFLLVVIAGAALGLWPLTDGR